MKLSNPRHLSRRFCGMGACLLAVVLAGGVRAGTIAHWSFDDPDADGTYPDSVPNGHPATPVDKSAIQAYSGSPAAPFGKAVTFTGTPSSYFTLPPLSNIQKTSLSVAAWVNFTTPGPNFILSDWKSSREAGFVFGVNPLGPNKSTAQPIADLGSAELRSNSTNRRSVVRQALPNASVPLNEWHHIAWTWDRESTTLTAYLDGKSLGEQRKQSYAANNGWSRSLDIAINNNPMRIGSQEMPPSGTSAPAVFHGSLDELWIFDEALTPIQMDNLVKTNNIRGVITPPEAIVGTPPVTGGGGTGPAPQPVTPNPAPVPVAAGGPASTENRSKPALGSTAARGASPGRVAGIVSCLTVIVAMSCYLFWAFAERAKLRASGHLP
jgi:hypothetical protein